MNTSVGYDDIDTGWYIIMDIYIYIYIYDRDNMITKERPRGDSTVCFVVHYPAIGPTRLIPCSLSE